jgi:hypothetical protein
MASHSRSITSLFVAPVKQMLLEMPATCCSINQQWLITHLAGRCCKCSLRGPAGRCLWCGQVGKPSAASPLCPAAMSQPLTYDNSGNTQLSAACYSCHSCHSPHPSLLLTPAHGRASPPGQRGCWAAAGTPMQCRTSAGHVSGS